MASIFDQIRNTLKQLQTKGTPINSIGQSRPNIPQDKPINWGNVANNVSNFGKPLVQKVFQTKSVPVTSLIPNPGVQALNNFAPKVSPYQILNNLRPGNLNTPVLGGMRKASLENYEAGAARTPTKLTPQQQRDTRLVAFDKHNRFLRSPEGTTEFAFALSGGSPVKNFTKQQLQMVRNGFGPEVRNLIGKFAEVVEQDPGAGRKSTGQIGDYVQSVAETVFGKKVSTLNNKQLLNLLDGVQEEAFNLRKAPRFSVGLGTDDLGRSSKTADELPALRSMGKNAYTNVRRADDRLANVQPLTEDFRKTFKPNEAWLNEPTFKVSKGEGESIGTIANRLNGGKAQSVKEVIEDPKFVNDRDYVKKKYNIMDKIRTPENVLRKMGLGDEADMLRAADEGALRDLRSEVTQLKSWIDRAPAKGSSERIFKYLDGQRQDLSGEELKVAQEMKDSLATWAVKLKLPQEKRITNYVTHIFEKGQIEKEFDPELEKLIGKSGTAGSVYNPYMQARKDAPLAIQDAFRAYQAYIKRGTRQFNYNPALERLKESAKDLDTQSMKYIERYSHKLNYRPTDIDSQIDNFIKSTPFGYKVGQRPVAAISSTWTRMIFRGALGLNPASAIINLSQGANTIGKIGLSPALRGYVQASRKIAARDLDELIENGILDDNIIQDRNLSAYKSVLAKLDPALMVFFNNAEKVNRAGAYYGAKVKALGIGQSEKEAIEYAKKIVRTTQFSYSKLDTPEILQSDIARALLPFMTYPLKQTEFIAGMIKNKELAGLIKWSAATMAFYLTVGKVLGRDPSEAIPFSGFATGKDKFNTPTMQIASTAKDLVSLDENKRAQAKRDLPKSASLLIPGGVQARKTLEGIGAFQQGASQTPTGRERFKIEQTPFNAARAVILGQYSLPGARDYFNNLGKSKSEIIYNGLKDLKTAEERKQRWKELVKDGTITKSNQSDVKQHFLDAKLGVTDDEAKMRNMGVADGQRAREIVEQLKKAKSAEERKALYLKYVRSKIITDEVGKQVKYLYAKKYEKNKI